MEGFREKYEKAEANKNIKFKKKVPARELMGLLAKERLETGRIYTMFVDHANEHGSWLDQVDTSNLCLEVNHPLIPITDVNDKNGEIGVCILAALNWLEIKDDEEMEKAEIAKAEAVAQAEQFKKDLEENNKKLSETAAKLAELENTISAQPPHAE